MAEFKVGDRVRVTDAYPHDDDAVVGVETTIVRIVENDLYPVVLDLFDEFYVKESEIEHVEPETVVQYGNYDLREDTLAYRAVNSPGEPTVLASAPEGGLSVNAYHDDEGRIVGVLVYDHDGLPRLVAEAGLIPAAVLRDELRYA